MQCQRKGDKWNQQTAEPQTLEVLSARFSALFHFNILNTAPLNMKWDASASYFFTEQRFGWRRLFSGKNVSLCRYFPISALLNIILLGIKCANFHQFYHFVVARNPHTYCRHTHRLHADYIHRHTHMHECMHACMDACTHT